MGLISLFKIHYFLLVFSEVMGAKKDPKKDSKTPSKTPKKKEGGGSKAKKKKWSKGKSRDKLNNLVLFDKVGTCSGIIKDQEWSDFFL